MLDKQKLKNLSINFGFSKTISHKLYGLTMRLGHSAVFNIYQIPDYEQMAVTFC